MSDGEIVNRLMEFEHLKIEKENNQFIITTRFAIGVGGSLRVACLDLYKTVDGIAQKWEQARSILADLPTP